jgi:hypothetical protein
VVCKCGRALLRSCADEVAGIASPGIGPLLEAAWASSPCSRAYSTHGAVPQPRLVSACGVCSMHVTHVQLRLARMSPRHMHVLSEDWQKSSACLVHRCTRCHQGATACAPQPQKAQAATHTNQCRTLIMVAQINTYTVSWFVCLLQGHAVLHRTALYCTVVYGTVLQPQAVLAHVAGHHIPYGRGC